MSSLGDTSHSYEFYKSYFIRRWCYEFLGKSIIAILFGYALYKLLMW